MPKTLHSVAILSMLLLVSACDKTQQIQPEEPLRPVRTIAASASDGISGRDFPGIVIAQNKADLSFRVAGKLKQIIINEGDRVKKGQIIARLDQTDFRITLDDKKANHAKAKANFTRSAKLVEPGYISQRDFDQITADYRTATARLKAARQDLAYTELKAPFAGSITKKYVDNFEEVQAKAIIATLQDLNSMEIEIDVPESLMIHVKRGDNSRKIYATFDAITDTKFPLTFREISTQADETTRAYKVRFSLPPINNYTVLPGMTATVIADRIPTDGRATNGNDIIIPSHAVLEDKKGRFVYIAELESPASTTAVISRRNVTTSLLTNNGLTVTSGINLDDQIVTAGMSKMHEGMRVKLMANPDLTGQDN
jgi:RND family efflux transporter MFP subunit